MLERSEVVRVLRTWVDVPWRAVGCHRETGVNCLGLIIGVTREIPELVGMYNTLQPYSGFAAPEGYATLLARLGEHLQYKPYEEVLPADLVLFKVDNQPQHVGMVSQAGSVVHCWQRFHKVVEHRILNKWRPHATFALRELPNG